jgi:serine/threonine protein kinase
LIVGSSISHYRIVAKLGEGGMGVVYKAEDTKLKRQVALKFLAAHLLSDAEAKERFLREAQAAAALHHPNVCPVYEIDEIDGKTFLAMAFLEGESLEERITEGPLSLEDALAIARQVADGLEAAHEKGIFHRDIKPANIMVDAKGRATIMDFGLARLTEASRLTKVDKAMGTVAYMSPEQAQGMEVDGRTDIWALGCVLYEMVVGVRPFLGEYDQAVLYSILNEEPEPMTGLRTGVPMESESIVGKCLSKSAGDRYQSATELSVDLRRAVGEQLSSSRVARKSTAQALPQTSIRAWPIAVGLALLAAAIVFWASRPDGGPTDPWRITRVTTTPELERHFSASSSSSLIAYSSLASGNSDIYVKPFRGGKPLQLTTDLGDDTQPRLSPDGEFVVFHSNQEGGRLDSVPVTGGMPQPLARTNWQGQGPDFVLGMSPWRSESGSQELLFSRHAGRGSTAIWKIDMASREEVQLSHPLEGDRHYSASYSPDGDQIVFTRERSSRIELWAMAADGGEARPILQDRFRNQEASWTPDGTRLVFRSDRSGTGNLWELTVASNQLRQITVGPGEDSRALVVPGKGLFYIQYGHSLNLFSVDLDSDTREALTMGSDVARVNPRFSPDGRYVVFDSDQNGDYEIFKLSLGNGEITALTDNPAQDRYPDWSPVSAEVVFLSTREGEPALWIMNAEGSGSRRIALPPDAVQPELGLGPNAPYGPPRWSPEGDVIAYVGLGENGPELWSVRADGSDVKRLLPVVNSFDWYGNSGRLVVYSTPPVGGQAELRAVNLDTDEEVVLLDGAYMGVNAAPDGASVAYISIASHSGQGYTLLPLSPPTRTTGLPSAAGPAESLANGRGLWHVHAGAFSPDGSLFVYDHDEDYGDILLIENYQ